MKMAKYEKAFAAIFWVAVAATIIGLTVACYKAGYEDGRLLESKTPPSGLTLMGDGGWSSLSMATSEVGPRLTMFKGFRGSIQASVYTKGGPCFGLYNYWSQIPGVDSAIGFEFRDEQPGIFATNVSGRRVWISFEALERLELLSRETQPPPQLAQPQGNRP